MATCKMNWSTKRSKYHNETVEVDGIRYDSKNEMLRHNFLKMMERAGEISELRYHVKFTLFPKGSTELIRMPDGTEVELKKYDREHWYEADFVYKNKRGEMIVEDFKGFETEEFKRKRIIFNAIYHQDIKIVKLTNASVN